MSFLISRDLSPSSATSKAVVCPVFERCAETRSPSGLLRNPAMNRLRASRTRGPCCGRNCSTRVIDSY